MAEASPAHRDDLDLLPAAIRSMRRKPELWPANRRPLINGPGVGYRLAEGD
ncbi:hypothetical protein [Novosphingobium sp.]|uniref:hypothetical protein n=1 Tax=Novosphingobium sp. TaxID=1874826 RepID=UPI0027368895|nr:hypothetical protein [Novosphingobium sp.]MDP3906967.1 hypothetical protein [Novosphingobium sp.]